MDWPLRCGIFMAPFHPHGQNPTLALERDLELVEHLDRLGFDEAWIGEHHSGGLRDHRLAGAVHRRRGRAHPAHQARAPGVVSLPYHHPFMTAQRIVQLDHLTRGRVMLGVGPGALPSDAFMLGIDPSVQRDRMEESLDVILAAAALRRAGHPRVGLVHPPRRPPPPDAPTPTPTPRWPWPP